MDSRGRTRDENYWPLDFRISGFVFLMSSLTTHFSLCGIDFGTLKSMPEVSINGKMTKQHNIFNVGRTKPLFAIQMEEFFDCGNYTCWSNFATNVVNSPLKILSVAAGDINTGRCRDLGYAVNAVYALGKNFMGAV